MARTNSTRSKVFIFDPINESYHYICKNYSVEEKTKKETLTKKLKNRLKKYKVNSDSLIIKYDEKDASKRNRARDCDIPAIIQFLKKKIGKEVNPVENVEEYLHCVRKRQKKLRKKGNSDGFFLFRGTPAKFDICGRIKYDASQLKSLETYKLKASDPNKTPSLLKKEFVEEIEKMMLTSYSQRARAFLDKPANNKFEEITHARHNGLSTRTLDWSRSPLVGLWFAVSDQPQHRSKHSVVSIFHATSEFLIIQEDNNYCAFENHLAFSSPFDVDSFDFEKNGFYNGVALYRPPSLSPRIDAQSSWFTIHAFKFKKVKKGKPYGNYCSLSSSENISPIFIKSNRTFALRRELNTMGIDEVSIFKDADHLATYIKNKYFKMSDEIFSDEKLKPPTIYDAFKQLQSTLALYNSEEVQKLQFLNLKGAYQRLTRILSSNKMVIKKFYTINDMNRDFLSYASQREVFLRMLEDELSQNRNGVQLDYKRIQLIVHEKLKDLNPQSEADKKALFDTFYIKTDNVSKQHLLNLKKINNEMNWLKYRFAKAEDAPINFALIEYYMEGDAKKLTYCSLIFELNSKSFPDIVASDQDMCFWLDLDPFGINKGMKGASDRPLYKSYLAEFNRQFDSDVNHGHNSVSTAIKSNRTEILEGPYHKRYLRVEVFLHQGKSGKIVSTIKEELKRRAKLKETKPSEKFCEILVDLSNRSMFPNLQALIDFCYQRVKSSKEAQKMFNADGSDILTPFRMHLAEKNKSGWRLYVNKPNKKSNRWKPINSMDLESLKLKETDYGYQSSSYKYFYKNDLESKGIKIKNGMRLALVYCKFGKSGVSGKNN